MKSMTGFGRAELKTKLGRFWVEVSSVNNRFLEISARLPRQFFAYEAKLRDLLSSELNRGKVFLYVGFDESADSDAKFAINSQAARAYYRQLVALKKEFGMEGDVEMRDLIALPDIAKADKEEYSEQEIWPPLEKAAVRAIKQLVAMRHTEGVALVRDMRGRLKEIQQLVKQITAGSSGYVKAYRERLTLRLEELLESPPKNALRIEEEIVMIAERTDITEECTRLKSHIDQFRSNLSVKVPVGKKLNFILQEMNREANTIASKCADIGISKAAISMKEEVEKLREQVQNVE